MDFLASLKACLLAQQQAIHEAILAIELVEKQLSEVKSKDDKITNLVVENSFLVDRERRRMEWQSNPEEFLKPIGIEPDAIDEKFGVYRLENGVLKRVVEE